MFGSKEEEGRNAQLEDLREEGDYQRGDFREAVEGVICVVRVEGFAADVEGEKDSGC